MANRPQMVLAAVVITSVAFLPVAAFAGGGGSPPAPGAAGAGSSSLYCCALWTDTLIGDGKSAIHVLTGSGCTAIDDTAVDRNSCNVQTGAGSRAVKCRGEFYSPTIATAPPFNGTVQRCFSP